MKSMIPHPMEPEYFEKICRSWSDVIIRLESGTFIAAPQSSQYRTIVDFFQDTSLQQKLFGKLAESLLMVYVDFKGLENLSSQELEHVLVNAIHMKYEEMKHLSLKEIITTLGENKRLILFVEGIDASIRNNQWAILDRLSTLVKSNHFIQVLVITETNIMDPAFFSHYGKYTTLCQNIRVLPRFDPSQGKVFQKHLEHSWEISPSPEQQKWIDENTGGHFTFLKEAFRHIKEYPSITHAELESLASIEMKAKAIYDGFLPKEQEVLKAIALGVSQIPESLSHALSHLKSLGWIVEQEGQLTISVPLVQKVIAKLSQNHARGSHNAFVAFTKVERTILALLQQNTATIVTREEIAKSMWGVEWEEKYSDWAIDQAIHKLREKMEKEGLGYKLQTKKGEGFILLPKAA